MKAFNKKKGFTIVELVIVVAVIGVLTAVLVPTFVNLVNKANQAADESLVTNLNKQLEIKRATEGSNKTMQEALDDALEGGYKVDNLTPTSTGKDIIWSVVEDKFFFVDSNAAPVGAKSANPYDYFKVYNNKNDIPTTQTFSIYAKGTDWTDVPTLTVGFDAGENLGIASLNFVTPEIRTATIRTNGSATVLTVNAKKSTIHHYDVLDGLTVTAVAGESYHEWGTVNSKAVISEGHIAVEEGASVPEVSVESATGDVKVTANEETLISVDNTSSSQTTVVANSDNVYVSGVDAEQISGSKKDSVELPTVVTSQTEMAAAVAAKKEFIQLGADFTDANSYTLDSKAIVDFAGHTISATAIGTSQADLAAAIDAMDPDFEFVNTPFFLNKSNLTLVNTASTVGGIVSANNLVVYNKGTLEIASAKLAGNLQIHAYMSGEGTSEAQDNYRNALGIKRGVIHNEADAQLLIKSVDLYTKSDYGVLNWGNATINGGVFNSDSSHTTGGYAYCVTNNKDMVINNATVNGTHGGIGGNAGTLIINNVTAKAKNFYGLYAAGEVGVASCIVNNGSFESEKQSAVLVGNSSDGGAGLPADVTINNGIFKGSTVSGSNPAVKISKQQGGGTYGLGFVTINGGKFNSNVSSANGVHTCVQGEDGLWVVNA